MSSIPFTPHPPGARLHEGRRALVTGADSGIGQAIALDLAAHGAAVAINHVGDPAVAGEMAAAIASQGGVGVPVRMDVSDEESVTAGFALAQERLGGLDLLVNNAGVEKKFDVVDMPLAEWERVIGVNLTGTFLCSRAAARIMREQESDGVILNISSVHEVIPWDGFAHYCASKGGVKLFAQSLARELAPHGIRVLNVAPGAIETPINAGVIANAEQYAAVVAEVPLGRWGKTEDVSRVVAWAASEQAGYVTGSTIFVDGGMTLYPRFV